MFQPELTTLLECLSLYGDASGIERFVNLSSEEWHAVIALAERHGVSLLLIHRLKILGIPLPDDLAATYRNKILGTAARNMVIYRELGGIIRSLQAEQIPLILLKGVYLAEKVYDNIGLRSMADVDLMIPSTRVEGAIQVLKNAGFIAERPFRREVDSILHYHAPVMQKDGLILEIHWNLTRDSNLSNIDTDALWQRARQIPFQDFEVWALSLSDLVLHLAVHAAYGHKFHYQLRSLCDLQEVIHKYQDELDWAEITNICQEWQAERGTYLAFRMLAELFSVEIPAAVLKALQPPEWSEQVKEWALVMLFQPYPILSENYIRVMHSRNLGERFSSLMKGLFPSRKIMAMEYGYAPKSWQTTALYPWHMLTRFYKYWKYPLRLLRGDRAQTVKSVSDQSLRDWLGDNENAR